jgi:hypothetical protein
MQAPDALLAELLEALWARYRARMEPVRKYEQLVLKQGGAFRNDHIAFRTIAWQKPAAGLFSVSRLFQALGYAPAGCYDFPDKKLNALHFEHRDKRFPKLFISELRAWELSAATRQAIGRSLERHRPPLDLDSLTLEACLDQLTRRPWPAPEKKDVLAADRESQYAAWVLAHGYEVNHFTGACDDIEKTVAAMRAAGVAMKAEIEGARGSALRQSSTESVVLTVDVADGGRAASMPWTYAYFELAERPLLTDPATGEKRRFEGFLGSQATNLFDMTRFAR